MISIKEQSILSDELIDTLGIDEYLPSLTSGEVLSPQKLGLSIGVDRNIWSSYYIGVTKFSKDVLAVIPKVDNVDYMTLFSYALMYEPSANYFSSCYEINWDEEVVVNSQLYNVLTPLLVIQYLTVLEKLVGRGLKKDYITHEENLHGKIKGKINISKQLRQNVLKKREDFFYCQYQEYTADIPVNRLLKKALNASLILLSNIRAKSNNIQSSSFVSSKLKIIEVFRNIGSDVQLQSIKTYKYDKLNIYYPQAISLAKQIIKHYDNSMTNSQTEKKIPPFWIDMSRLFEIYVLGLLRTNYSQSILFQVKGSYGTQCDYLHTQEGVIIDAKYKTWYCTKSQRESHNSSLVADIREISGYARDEKLLEYFPSEYSDNPICIVIHPGEMQTIDFSQTLSSQNKEEKIEGYKNFYHFSIPLPTTPK